MKKILLSLAFFSFCYANAQVPEQLDQAIKDSNLTLVKKLLQETSLSAKELLSLSDLSQQIISYRQGQVECDRVSLRQTPAQLALAIGGTVSLLASILFTFSLFEAGGNPDYVKPSLLMAGASIASAIFFFNRCAQSRLNGYNILKKNFDNALAVRQLLLQQNPA